VRVELDPSLLESDPIGIRRATRSDEKIGAFDGVFAMPVLDEDPDLLA
jgi:hypothetical protein